jgi:hypothetical protein
MAKLKLYNVEITIEAVVLAPDQDAAEDTALDNLDKCIDWPTIGSVVEIPDEQHLPDGWDKSLPFCDEVEEYAEEGLTCQGIFKLWKQQQEDAVVQAEQDRRQLKLFTED